MMSERLRYGQVDSVLSADGWRPARRLESSAGVAAPVGSNATPARAWRWDGPPDILYNPVVP